MAAMVTCSESQQATAMSFCQGPDMLTGMWWADPECRIMKSHSSASLIRQYSICDGGMCVKAIQQRANLQYDDSIGICLKENKKRVLCLAQSTHPMLG